MANTSTFFFYLAVGFNVATTTRIGNAVGKKCPNKAQNYFISSLITAFLISFVEIGFMYSIRNYWVYLFTDDKEIIDILLKTLYVWCILIIPDNLQMAF